MPWIELPRMKDDHSGNFRPGGPPKSQADQREGSQSKKSPARKRKSRAGELKNGHRNPKNPLIHPGSKRQVPLTKERCGYRKSARIIEKTMGQKLLAEPRIALRIDGPAWRPESEGSLPNQLAQEVCASIEKFGEARPAHLSHQIMSDAVRSDLVARLGEPFHGLRVALRELTQHEAGARSAGRPQKIDPAISIGIHCVSTLPHGLSDAFSLGVELSEVGVLPILDIQSQERGRAGLEFDRLGHASILRDQRMKTTAKEAKIKSWNPCVP